MFCIDSKMAVPCFVAAASTLKSVQVLEMKVPSVLSESMEIVSRKYNCITELLYDYQSILYLEIFSNRGTIDKAVLESLCCFRLFRLKVPTAEVWCCMEGVRLNAISESDWRFGRQSHQGAATFEARKSSSSAEHLLRRRRQCDRKRK